MGDDPVYTALAALKEPIGRIDSGCRYCVGGFVKAANDSLRQKGVPYRFVMGDDSYDCVGIDIEMVTGEFPEWEKDRYG